MSTTPPGWYDDGRGALRWWDGAQWTEHVQTPDPEPAVDEQPASAGAEQPTTPGEAGADAATAERADTMDALLAPAVGSAAHSDQPGASAPDAGTATTDGPPAVTSDTMPEGGYPPSAPPGYPGGFPGGPAPSGAFISATEPRKSKLWILWVVLGVVLLGIVILATVFIPIIIGMFSNAGGGAATEDETAAVAAVELYDEAWGTADCDKFVAATTEEFRDVLQLPDCETFAAAAQGFIDSVDEYEVTVLNVETEEDQITVETSETYTSMSDPDGNPTEEPVEYDDRYAYSVVPSGQDWVINEAIAQN
jgi:hypothetical protein